MNWLGRFLHAYDSQEQNIAQTFLVFTILIGLVNSLGRSVSQTLFLAEVGSAQLKYLWPIQEILIAFMALVYVFLARKYHAGAVTGLLLSISCFFLALVWYILSYIHSESIFIYYVLNVIFYVPSVIIGIHLAPYLQLHMTPLQRKRLMAPILSGILIGSVIGGGSYTLLISFYGISVTIFICIILYTVLLFMVSSFKKNKSILQDMRKVEYGDKNVGLVSQFKVIINMPLVRLMSIFSLIMFIISKLVEYHVMSIFLSFSMDNAREGHMDSTEELSTESVSSYLGVILGIYESSSNIIAFFIQIMITPVLIRVMGIGRSNTVYPKLHVINSTLIMGAMLLVFLDVILLSGTLSLIVAIIAQMINSETRRSIMRPTFNLLFNGVPAQFWSQSNSLINGIFNPIGVLFATGIILIIEMFIDPYVNDNALLPNSVFLGSIGFIVLILSFLYVFVSYYQSRAYSHSIFNLLKDKIIDLSHQGLDFGVVDERCCRIVERALDDPQPKKLALGIELAYVLCDPRFFLKLVKCFDRAPDKSKITIIKTLCSYKSSPKIMDILLHWSNDSNLSISILRELVLALGLNLSFDVHEFVKDPRLSVSMAARVVRHRRGEESIIPFLQKLGIGENEEAEVIELCWAMSVLKLEELVPYLISLFSDKYGRSIQSNIVDVVYDIVGENKSVDISEDKIMKIIGSPNIKFHVKHKFFIMVLGSEFYLDAKYVPIVYLLAGVQSEFLKNAFIDRMSSIKFSQEVRDTFIKDLMGLNLDWSKKEVILCILFKANLISPIEIANVFEYNFQALIFFHQWSSKIYTFERHADDREKIMSLIQRRLAEHFRGALSILLWAIFFATDKDDPACFRSVYKGLLSTDRIRYSTAVESLTGFGKFRFSRVLANFLEIIGQDQKIVDDFLSRIEFKGNFFPVSDITQFSALSSDSIITAAIIHYFYGDIVSPEIYEQIRLSKSTKDAHVLDEVLDYGSTKH